MTPQEKTQKALRAAKRVRNDFPWYASRFLKIRTKDAKIEALQLNDTQSRLDALWREHEAAKKPIRFLILKARQEGVSTYTDARLFHRIATRPNRHGLILSHEDDASVALFDMVKLYLDALPAPLRPMQRYSSRRELVFENPDESSRVDRPGLRSRLSVASARNLTAGKGTTLHYVHLSELAFYRNARALLASLLQAVPDSPDTAVVIETTPNGVGDDFHALWQGAKDGTNGWTPIFFPWFIHDEYRRGFDSTEIREGFERSLSSEEITAQRAYDLDLEQLNWRREKIKTFTSLAEFLNQYPENDTDCFLTSGRPVFPVDAVKEQIQNIREPRWRGDIMEEEDGSLRFEPSPTGPLKVWEWPKDETPVIGVDVAEGLEQGDYSVAEIILPSSKRQIAQWHGHTDPDLLGEVLYRLGWYFKEAMIAVEVNNHGFTTLTTLKKRYGKLYYRALPNPADPSEDQDQRLGWKTDLRTKPQMEDHLRQHLRESAVVIRCKETVDELFSYVVHDDGSTGANTNCHDDRAIALMIALQASRNAPPDPQKAALRKAKRRRLLNQFSR